MLFFTSTHLQSHSCTFSHIIVLCCFALGSEMLSYFAAKLTPLKCHWKWIVTIFLNSSCTLHSPIISTFIKLSAATNIKTATSLDSSSHISGLTTAPSWHGMVIVTFFLSHILDKMVQLELFLYSIQCLIQLLVHPVSMSYNMFV